MVSELHCSYELPENVRNKNETLESWHCRLSFRPYLEDGLLCIFHYPGSKKRAEDLDNFNCLLQEKQTLSIVAMSFLLDSTQLF